MREHLATLIDDFRRFDREIAVVRYQGNRRRVTTYGDLAQPCRAVCRAAGSPRHLCRATACSSGLKTAPSGSPPFMDACCAAFWPFPSMPTEPPILPSASPPMSAPNLLSATHCCSANSPRQSRFAVSTLAFEDWLAELPADEAGAISRPFRPNSAADSLYLRHHRRPQRHRAHPRQRAGQRRTHRRRRASPICATSASSIRCAFCNTLAAQPRLRPDHGSLGSAHPHGRTSL